MLAPRKTNGFSDVRQGGSRILSGGGLWGNGLPHLHVLKPHPFLIFLLAKGWALKTLAKSACAECCILDSTSECSAVKWMGRRHVHLSGMWAYSCPAPLKVLALNACSSVCSKHQPVNRMYRLKKNSCVRGMSEHTAKSSCSEGNCHSKDTADLESLSIFT